MKKIYLLFALIFIFLGSALNAQIILSSPNGTYLENFDGMGSTTTLPAGWMAVKNAGSSTAAVGSSL
ncbi:MAG: hypothetical protein ABIN57_08410, partial [Chitinophagaceae bacterium]